MGDRDLILGYGTLLYRPSLGDSIGASEATRRRVRPVIVRGWKRLFNLRPDHYEPSSILSSGAVEAAAMNVEPDERSSMNAVCIEVTSEELLALDRRERYYDRRRVQGVDYRDAEPVEAILYYAPRGDRRLCHDPGLLLPLWRDLVWGIEGCRDIDQEFAEIFKATTFLADGETLASELYREFLDGPEYRRELRP